MERASTNRENVLATLSGALQQMELEATAGPALPPGARAMAAPSDAEAMAAELRRAQEWALTYEQELARKGEIDDLSIDEVYVSRDPVISLVQSAIDEAARRQAGTRAAGLPRVPVSLVADFLKYRFVRKPDFPHPTGPDDQRYDLPERCTVALVADWGTGLPGSIKVAKAIAGKQPEHVIHLGDVYHSGTPEEIERHFIGVWNEHGPPGARFWALNGNHEMHAKGIGYFGTTLPWCGQPKPYFNLGNAHWRLVALDTAYDSHDLHGAQKEWLAAQLTAGAAKKILLTHHQMFSAVDERPSQEKLAATMRPFVATGNAYAWFWGHEHGCLIYEDAAELGGMRARCIGHGGKRVRLPYYEGHRHPAPRVLNHWAFMHADDPSHGLNGFALLRFDGPELKVEYIDEDGRAWWPPEVWRADA